jgi:hypothetical protein
VSHASNFACNTISDCLPLVPHLPAAETDAVVHDVLQLQLIIKVSELLTNLDAGASQPGAPAEGIAAAGQVPGHGPMVRVLYCTAGHISLR